jgi:sulfane dehydrogenase subunit SoxC
VVEKGWIALKGLAWSGRGKIHKVVVWTNGGKFWQDAILQPPVLDKAHVRFNHLFFWDGKETEIRSRAIDETGYVQPSPKVLRQARGADSGYHFNPVTGWVLKNDGRVLFNDDF